MHPKSVEIKATLTGSDVDRAVAALPLADAKTWRIVFCEDVTGGVAPLTPLLEIGVILRVRGKSGSKGDSTVKLRPCRWSQLTADFFANAESDHSELKIEADWAGSKRTLTASLTADWDDDRLDSVRSGGLPVSGLFTEEQRRFLEQCSSSPVNLDALTALADIDATRWKEFPIEVETSELNCRAERWVIGGAFDFLEVSIVSDVVRADRDQAALHYFLARHSLAVEPNQDNKTQRVLNHLVASTARTE